MQPPEQDSRQKRDTHGTDKPRNDQSDDSVLRGATDQEDNTKCPTDHGGETEQEGRHLEQHHAEPGDNGQYRKQRSQQDFQQRFHIEHPFLFTAYRIKQNLARMSVKAGESSKDVAQLLLNLALSFT